MYPLEHSSLVSIRPKVTSVPFHQASLAEYLVLPTAFPYLFYDAFPCPLFCLRILHQDVGSDPQKAEIHGMFVMVGLPFGVVVRSGLFDNTLVYRLHLSWQRWQSSPRLEPVEHLSG